jgi:ankyrin repeat protein
MGRKVKDAAWWAVAVLSVAGAVAADTDLRLVEAVRSRNRDIQSIRALIEQRVDLDAAYDGATALAWASHRDDLETADLLIGAGANVNAANDYGVTPLFLACTNASAGMVAKLLKAGANPNASLFWTGETVLMTCARTGSATAVKLLLESGANVNARENKKEQTALMWAVVHKHPEVVRVLIAHGADIRARSKGDFLEPRFAQGGRGAAAAAEVGSSGFTPLLYAAQQGDVESARILLEAGADVNEETKETGSALVVAAASGQEAFAIFMLERGADPNRVDSYGVSALHFAAREGLGPGNGIQYNTSYRLAPPGMPALARALLAHKANPNARIKRDYSGNSFFYRPSRLSLVGATPFWVAAAAYDANIMRILVEGGADPLLATEGPPPAVGTIADKKDDKGSTIPSPAPGLKQPTKDSKEPASNVSYEQKPAPPRKWGVTPLMAAAGLGTGLDYVYSEETENKALEAVALALKLGNDVNAVADSGRTAMHGAALLGANKIVRLLADRGAKPDVKDRNGMTPWSLSMGLQIDAGDSLGLYHKETAELLLKMGADPGVEAVLTKMRIADLLAKEAAREAAIKKKEAAKRE